MEVILASEAEFDKVKSPHEFCVGVTILCVMLVIAFLASACWLGNRYRKHLELRRIRREQRRNAIELPECIESPTPQTPIHLYDNSYIGKTLDHPLLIPPPLAPVYKLPSFTTTYMLTYANPYGMVKIGFIWKQVNTAMLLIAETFVGTNHFHTFTGWTAQMISVTFDGFEVNQEPKHELDFKPTFEPSEGSRFEYEIEFSTLQLVWFVDSSGARRLAGLCWIFGKVDDQEQVIAFLLAMVQVHSKIRDLSRFFDILHVTPGMFQNTVKISYQA